MSDIISILHLEDDPADAELVRGKLEKARIPCTITRIQTPAEFEAALRQGGYDLILADYHLPGYDGIHALKLVRELRSTIPFIFVSGTLGEEAAIEGLTEGATDYVLKQRLSRLAPAVRRAIHEAATRRESERAKEDIALMSFALDNVREAAYLIDEDGRFRFVNAESCRELGYSREQLLALTVSDVDPHFPPDVWAQHWKDLKKNGSLLFEGEHRGKDGRKFPVEIYANYLEYAGTGYNLALVRDISDRVKAEVELRKLWHVVEQSPASVIVTDPRGSIEYVNPKFTQLTGYTLEDVRGKNPRILKSGEMSSDMYKELWETISAGGEWHGEFHNKKKNGELFWEAASISAIRTEQGDVTHYVAIKEDITQRKRADLALRASLQEKETLLREIHHRVKNNLQIISSLLSLQAHETADPRLTKSFAESRNRIRSMALVHEQLYQSQNFSAIDFRKYLEVVISRLMEQQPDSHITSSVDAEDIWLDIDRAIPCGLIVNELVTNCLKHAFVGRSGGRVALRMRRIAQNLVRLEVEDDGCGFPGEIDFYNAKTMGVTIVRTLVEQLEGTIRKETGAGTHFIIEFRAPDDPPAGAVLQAG